MNPLIPSLKTLCKNAIEAQKNMQQDILQIEPQLNCLCITDENVFSINAIAMQSIHKLVISFKTRWRPFDLSQLTCKKLQELDMSISKKQVQSVRISYCSNNKFAKLPQTVRETIKILKITGQSNLSEIGIFPQLKELHATTTRVSHVDNFLDLYLKELHIYKLTQQHISSFTYQQRQICTHLSIEKTDEIDDLGEFQNLAELKLIGKKLPKFEGACGKKLKKLYLFAYVEKYVIETGQIHSEKLEELFLRGNVFFKSVNALKVFLKASAQTLHTLELNYYQNPLDFHNLELPRLKTLKFYDAMIPSDHFENISNHCPFLHSFELFWHSAYSNFYSINNPYKNVIFKQVQKLTLYYCEREFFFTDFYAVHAMFPNIIKLTWFLHKEDGPSSDRVQSWLRYAQCGEKAFPKHLHVEIKEWR